MVIGLDMVKTWRAGDLNYVALTYHQVGEKPKTNYYSFFQL